MRQSRTAYIQQQFPLFNIRLHLEFVEYLDETMLIGYARVSTDDQLLDLQRDAFQKAGCERMFEDTASGAKAERVGLTALLSTLRQGDTVVWRLDRLGRSLKDLIRLVEQMDAVGVGLRSLQESIDTTSIGGRLVFHLFGALAEFERNLIRERTQAGLSAARARGRNGGRKKRLGPAKQELALRLYHERKHTVAEICRLMGIGRSALYNYLTEAERNAQRAA
jgi:DNA invertase Pin-like site-specific DNA recombinase